MRSWCKNHLGINNNLVGLFAILPLLWFASFMTWAPRGDKYLGVLVLLSFCVQTYFFKFTVIKQNWASSKWLLILSASFLFGVISNEIHGFGSREISAMLISLMYLSCTPFDRFSKQVWLALGLMSTVSIICLLINYQIINDLGRRFWVINAIPYSNMVALLALLVLNFVFTTKYTKLLYVVWILLGIAVVVSESRGVILAYGGSVLFYLFIWAYGARKSLAGKGKVKLLLVLFSLILSGVASAPYLSDRMSKAINVFSSLEASDRATRTRLQVYEIGLDLWQEKPFLGHGKSLQPRFDEMLAKKEISQFAHQVLSWNFHNGYIEKMVVSGLLGLVFMLALLLYPIVFAWKHKGFAIISSCVLLYALTNLTDTPFTNGFSFMAYLFGVGILIQINSVQKIKEAKQ